MGTPLRPRYFIISTCKTVRTNEEDNPLAPSAITALVPQQKSKTFFKEFLFFSFCRVGGNRESPSAIAPLLRVGGDPVRANEVARPIHVSKRRGLGGRTNQIRCMQRVQPGTWPKRPLYVFFAHLQRERMKSERHAWCESIEVKFLYRFGFPEKYLCKVKVWTRIGA